MLNLIACKGKEQKMLYLNEQIGTDCKSYRVIKIDELKGVATVVEVERVGFKPNQVVGGFFARTINNYEQYDYPVQDDPNAKPFEVTRNKQGFWGRKVVVCMVQNVNSFKPEYLEEITSRPNVEVKGDYIYFYELTKSGKKKTKFVKMGAISDKCKAFYDYKF
jgi:hypothetical protein